jgi:sec-independent protein translocase protein TatA
MSMPGITELIIIAAVILLLFGANKLPKLGGAIGESIKNFKKGIKEDEKSITENHDKNSQS